MTTEKTSPLIERRIFNKINRENTKRGKGMKISLPIGIKAKLKKMSGPILEQMDIEQNLQMELRETMRTSTDPEEVAKAKNLFDESVKYWEVLKKALGEYNSLAAKNWKVSLDTILVVAGNLLGIVLILYFEKFDIVRSKALGFVLKGRV